LIALLTLAAAGLVACGSEVAPMITVSVRPQHVEVGQVPSFEFTTDRAAAVTAVIDWCETTEAGCSRWHRVDTADDIEVRPDDEARNTWGIFEAKLPGRYRVTLTAAGKTIRTLEIPSLR
jgi:hypothetical protein